MEHTTKRAATLTALKLLQSRGRWADIQLITELVSADLGARQTDSAISARVRELRLPKYGKHSIKCRRQSDGVYRYLLEEK